MDKTLKVGEKLDDLSSFFIESYIVAIFCWVVSYRLTR